MSRAPNHNLDPSQGIRVGVVDKHVDVTCALLCRALFADGDDWLPAAAVALRSACKDRCSSAVRGRNASKHRTWIGKRCSVAIEGELLACDDDKPPLRSGDDTDEFDPVSACVQKPALFDARRQSSVPHELATVVPSTVVPVQAILLKGQREYSMFPDLKRRHHWVLEPYQYESKEVLIARLAECVIAPAEEKAKELMRKYS